MAGSPPYKIFRDGEYIASVKYLEDAAALIGVCDSGVVKFGHSKIIWTEGSEDFEAGASYDRAAEVMRSRVQEIHEKSYAKNCRQALTAPQQEQ